MRWMLLENANVISLENGAGDKRGGSILIQGDRIAAVFREPHPDTGLAASKVKRVDLAGKTVLPGFTDSHIHLHEWGISLGRANLEHARSAEESVEALIAFHRKEPSKKGEWIVGRGWSHNQWRDPSVPTSTALIDAAFPDNPVWLQSLCGHLAWVNSAALHAAGIHRNSPEVVGGEITRHSTTGEPTGILKENAIELVERAMGKMSEDKRRRGLELAIREAHANGIVAVHDMEGVGTFELMQEAHHEGWLSIRVAFYLPVAVLDDAVKAGIRSGLGDARLKVGGVKLFTDGSLGGRTAWMLEPYDEEPKQTGIPVLHGDELLGIVRKANTNGLSCAIHAIGDRAIRETLQTYARVWGELDGNVGRAFLRNRIEHFQTVHPDDLRYLMEAPVAACMQPVHLYADWRAAERYMGKERARWTYACRSLLEAGACVALGSDAPVATVDVRQGIYAAIARRDLDGQPEGGWHPEEAIPAIEALKGYCSAPAGIALEEHERGKIRAGHRADLAVLDVDPLTASPEEILNASVVATLFDGEWVHGGIG